MLCRLGITVLATLAVSACSSIEGLDFDILPPELVAWASNGDGQAEAVEPGFAESLTAEWYVPEAPPPVPRRKPDHAAEPALGDLDPELLVGLDFAATKALLGDPVLQLEQPPAKVWAYNGGTCMFNVFFYPSVNDKIFRVLTYEVTGGDLAPSGGELGQGEVAPVKIRDRDSPVLRRCFADLLHSRDLSDAG